MDTKAFNEQNFDKSRAVCEGIEREDCCSDYKTETNKLRNQLNASERKSERRLRQIDHLESVIRNRNAELKKRKQLVHELRNEVRRLGKQVSDLSAEREDGDGRVVLTDRERQILDMWPKFEDGEHVWFGDDISEIDAKSFVFVESGAMVTNLTSVPAYGKFLRCREPLKRPTPKVLDADGVLIKMGDTVWHHSGFAHGMVTNIDAGSLMGTVRYVNGGVEFRDAAKDLTHTRPDSWERLEEDAAKDECDYFGFYAKECCGCPAYKPGDCDKFKALDRRCQRLLRAVQPMGQLPGGRLHDAGGRKARCAR